MPKQDFRYHITERVRWSDCDAQGIVFNGAYFSYLEVAQAGYYRNLGFYIYDEAGRRHFDTATVKATLEYSSPARVDDLIDIFWKVDQIGNTSLTSHSEIYRSGSDGLLLKAEVVYVDFDSDAVTARRVPDGLRKLIETFEATGEVLPLSSLPDLSSLAPVSAGG